VFRRNVEPAPRRGAFWLTLLALAPPLFLLSLWEGGSLRVGGIFFLGLAGSMAALTLAAKGLLALARRLPRPRRFAWKHGLHGLYRPGNQAVAVTLALGLGVLMVLSIYLLQVDLLRQVAAGRQGDEPNLFFIDIQDSQRAEFVDTLHSQGIANPELIPVVRGRVRALNGQPLRLDEIQDEEKKRVLSFPFAMTYRDHLVPGEQILKGRFGLDPAISGPQVSVAQWWTDGSGLGVGDTLTVDVQGVAITAAITSIRQVDWSNRRANFTLLFMPGALEEAPRHYVSTVRVETPAGRVALQKAVVARMPNVSAVDVELILRSLQEIVDRIALVIQFMALFSIGVGVLILGGAIAVTKYQRLRESVLLKTLGATRAAVAAVLCTEYALLGTLAGGVGAIAAGALSWGLVKFVFEGRWDFRPLPYGVAALAAAVLTTLVGLAANLDILNRKPMEVLREE
jgi:putative ABC transport system permease protein